MFDEMLILTSGWMSFKLIYLLFLQRNKPLILVNVVICATTYPDHYSYSTCPFLLWFALLFSNIYRVQKLRECWCWAQATTNPWKIATVDSWIMETRFKYFCFAVIEFNEWVNSNRPLSTEINVHICVSKVYSNKRNGNVSKKRNLSFPKSFNLLLSSQPHSCIHNLYIVTSIILCKEKIFGCRKTCILLLPLFQSKSN